MIHENYKAALRHARLSANHFRRCWGIWKLKEGRYETDIVSTSNTNADEVIQPSTRKKNNVSENQ